MHRHVNATARRDDSLGCGVEEAIHKPLHLFEVMIHGDQFRPDLNGLGRDPDVIGWDGGALFPELGGDSGVPVRRDGGQIDGFNNRVGDKPVQLVQGKNGEKREKRGLSLVFRWACSAGDGSPYW